MMHGCMLNARDWFRLGINRVVRGQTGSKEVASERGEDGRGKRETTGGRGETMLSFFMYLDRQLGYSIQLLLLCSVARLNEDSIATVMLCCSTQ